MSYQHVRSVVISSLSDAILKAGYDPATTPDSFNFLQRGVIDSFGFMDLLEELEDKLGISIDLTALESEDLATVGGLARQLGKLQGCSF